MVHSWLTPPKYKDSLMSLFNKQPTVGLGQQPEMDLNQEDWCEVCPEDL